MESTLKNPRGASHFLVEAYKTLIRYSSNCQSLLQQVQRDDNVRGLLEGIRDAFDFALDADALRNIKPKSKQAEILEEMLECVSTYSEFIELYAKDVEFGMSSYLVRWWL